MAHSPLDKSPAHTDAATRRPYVVRAFGAVDDAFYAFERTVVSGALLLMSFTVCLNIFYQFLASQRGTWNEIQAGTASWGSLWPVVLFAAAVLGLSHAGIARAPAMQGIGKLPWIGAVLVLVMTGILARLMLTAPSSTVCVVLAVLSTGALVLQEVARPIPMGTRLASPGPLGRVAAALLTGAGLVYAATLVPAGYTWAQKLALFLLLWVAFLGASMATHDGQHLTIDAVRKAIPARFLPWYNALSCVVAAAFTLAFLWLAWRYFGLRRNDAPIPGEIPDWLKVLSIPFSLALVSARFLGRAFTSVLDGIAGTSAAPAAPAPTEENPA